MATGKLRHAKYVASVKIGTVTYPYPALYSQPYPAHASLSGRSWQPLNVAR